MDDNRKMIRIPIEVFETAESKEDIEDWLSANDPDFIARLRRARAQDLAGQARPLEELENDLRTGS